MGKEGAIGVCEEDRGRGLALQINRAEFVLFNHQTPCEEGWDEGLKLSHCTAAYCALVTWLKELKIVINNEHNGALLDFILGQFLSMQHHLGSFGYNRIHAHTGHSNDVISPE